MSRPCGLTLDRSRDLAWKPGKKDLGLFILSCEVPDIIRSQSWNEEKIAWLELKIPGCDRACDDGHNGCLVTGCRRYGLVR